MVPKKEQKRPPTVLIVDDDGDFRESLGSFLQVNGLRVVEAIDGPEGLRLAMAERPDVIIMDIMMNERTEGLFALQSIRHTPELQHTAVIVVSSLYSNVAGFSVSPERTWMGQDEFFAKPVDMPRLLERVRAHAARSRGETVVPERK
jgi:two-component system alkaline phosphatase synthesis response regulator PhoP